MSLYPTCLIWQFIQKRFTSHIECWIKFWAFFSRKYKSMLAHNKNILNLKYIHVILDSSSKKYLPLLCKIISIIKDPFWYSFIHQQIKLSLSRSILNKEKQWCYFLMDINSGFHFLELQLFLKSETIIPIKSNVYNYILTSKINVDISPLHPKP